MTDPRPIVAVRPSDAAALCMRWEAPFFGCLADGDPMHPPTRDPARLGREVAMRRPTHLGMLDGDGGPIPGPLSAAEVRAQVEQRVRVMGWAVPVTTTTRTGLSAHERASRWLACVEPLRSGPGGHGRVWRVAQALVRGFGLEEGAAVALMRGWIGNARHDGTGKPWSDRELQHKARQARERSRLPHGHLLEQSGRAAA